MPSLRIHVGQIHTVVVVVAVVVVVVVGIVGVVGTVVAGIVVVAELVGVWFLEFHVLVFGGIV